MTSTVPSGRERFKQHLRKVGSGEHTSKGMSREEAADALELMLYQEATPAQIGAFLIAHRIRRPEPQELTGMLDTYRKLGPVLHSAPGQRSPLCFGMPYDGRTRTAPIYPLTTLVLLSCNQPVVLQGGERMPIKYGITAIELFRSLGLDLRGLPLETVQDGLHKQGFALIHRPRHKIEGSELKLAIDRLHPLLCEGAGIDNIAVGKAMNNASWREQLNQQRIIRGIVGIFRLLLSVEVAPHESPVLARHRGRHLAEDEVGNLAERDVLPLHVTCGDGRPEY